LGIKAIALGKTIFIVIEIMPTISPTYAEVIDFLAAGTTPNKIISFRVSDSVKERVADLIYQEKTLGLSVDEKSELDHYLQLEHLMRLIKARAYQYLSNGGEN
jgi:hypothetical protein